MESLQEQIAEKDKVVHTAREEMDTTVDKITKDHKQQIEDLKTKMKMVRLKFIFTKHQFAFDRPDMARTRPLVLLHKEKAEININLLNFKRVFFKWQFHLRV